MARLRRLALGAMRRLKLRGPGLISVAFVDGRTMQALNWRFLRHRGLTDVLSFRYEREVVVGEIVIAPAFARSYAAAHGLAYGDELARYLLHGLLHWIGHDDRTRAQQRRMRALEDCLLEQCGRS